MLFSISRLGCFILENSVLINSIFNTLMQLITEQVGNSNWHFLSQEISNITANKNYFIH